MNHPDRDKYDLSSLTRHHRRRRAAAGQPCRAAARGISRSPAGARLRPDRNQRGRLRQFLEQLRRQAGIDRPRAAAVRRAGDPRRRRPAPADRRSRRDRASARAANIKGYWRNPGGDRGAVHRRRLSSAPATSAISTRTAICSSSTARRTSSSAAARISPPPRSRRPATPARGRRSGGVRRARRAARRSAGRGHPPRRMATRPRTNCARSSTAQLAKFKIPARFIFSAEPLPRLGTGKIDRRALKAQYAR